MKDRTNSKLYTSYFPSIYIADSYNIATPTTVSGTLSASNYQRGAS